jgi:hypothetical protein
VVGCCKHTNEPSGSTNNREFDQLHFSKMILLHGVIKLENIQISISIVGTEVCILNVHLTKDNVQHNCQNNDSTVKPFK